MPDRGHYQVLLFYSKTLLLDAVNAEEGFLCFCAVRPSVRVVLKEASDGEAFQASERASGGAEMRLQQHHRSIAISPPQAPTA